MRNGTVTLRHLLQPIQHFLDDAGNTEIVINKPGEVGVENKGRWTWHDIPELTFNHLDAFGILSGRMLSREFSPYDPICMSELPSGQRITLLRPPVSESGTVSVTIRIPSQQEHDVWADDFRQLMRPARTTKSELTQIDQQLLSLYRAEDWANFLSLGVKVRKTIAVIGDTGSGKTTYLKRLLKEIPLHERVITVEDKPEFGRMPHRNRVQMIFGNAGVTATSAINATLRMRPDRVLMQELRGVEAVSYARLLVAGHPGGLTTWHADESDPFTPLTIMAKLNGEGGNIDTGTLEAIYRRFVDIIVFCKRDVQANKYASEVIYFKAVEYEKRLVA